MDVDLLERVIDYAYEVGNRNTVSSRRLGEFDTESNQQNSFIGVNGNPVETGDTSKMGKSFGFYREGTEAREVM